MDEFKFSSAVVNVLRPYDRHFDCSGRVYPCDNKTGFFGDNGSVHLRRQCHAFCAIILVFIELW